MQDRRLVALAVALSLTLGAGAGAVLRHDGREDPAPVIVSAIGTAMPSSAADVVERVAPSIVAIDVVLTDGDQGQGTGFVLRPDGLIATVGHLLEDAWSITIVLTDGSRLGARIVGVDPTTDLAVLCVDRDDLVPMAFGRTAAVRVGEPVVAIGHALGLGRAPTVSAGVLSAVERTVNNPEGVPFDHLLQTDAAINTGDSGGPLLNARGEVIGINTSKITTEDAEGVGFAICTDHALPALEELIEG